MLDAEEAGRGGRLQDLDGRPEGVALVELGEPLGAEDGGGVDEGRAGPAVAWIATTVAQQNPSVDLPGPLDIVVTGPGARTIRVGGDGPAAATITSDVEALCRWISQRGTWEDTGAVAEGDPATLAAARRLKVF